MSLYSDKGEYVESITYQPQVPTTGDLEPGVANIALLAEPAIPQYNAALTLGIPADSRLVIQRVAARVEVTIDAFNAGCAHLYCSVYVDVVDAAHRLFTAIDFAAIGAQAYSGTITAGTVFDLLTDGTAHTIYLSFWVDAGNADISLVQYWEGVGDNGVTGGGIPCLRLDYQGHVTIASRVHRIDAANTPQNCITRNIPADHNANFQQVAGDFSVCRYTMVWNNDGVFFWGTVATDINCLYQLFLNLRRMV